MLEPVFELEYLNLKLTVQTKQLNAQVLFKVNFSDGANAVIITRATDFGGKKFWTSVPEGRQNEAENIGPLIEQYYRAKQQ